MKVLSAVFATLLMCSNADAITILVDDFSDDQGPISDLNVDGVAVTDTVSLSGGVVDSRTLSIEGLLFLNPPQNAATIGGGLLDVTNGVGDDSEVIVTWNLLPNVFPVVPVTDVGFRLNVVQSDGNPTNVALAIGATNLGNFAIPGNTANQILPFALNPALVAAVNAGGPLTLTLDGAPGWDLALDQFDLTFNEQQTVIPEPGTITLLGIGLLGLGWSRWRRTGSAK